VSAYRCCPTGLQRSRYSSSPRRANSLRPQPGLVRQGPVNVYMRPVGSYWVTVVGEAPAESVKYIADAVEYRK